MPAMGAEVPYWQRRIESVVSHMVEPSYRARNFTFYVNQDDESLRREHLPRLNQYSDYVRYDPEGFIYVSHWSRTRRIPAGAKIVGPHQSWRNYSTNPPKKLFYRHNFDQVQGIDVALRRSMEIRDQYRSGGTETEAVLATFQRVGQLRHALGNFGELSVNDLDTIVEENQEFLEGQTGFTNPNLQGKERIVRHLGAGFLDKNGRKNYGAGMMRLLAVELELYKRWEGSFPPILAKQASIVEILEFEREFARQNLAWNQQRLEEASGLETREGESESSFTRRTERTLLGIAVSLTHNVVVMPYVVEAREVAAALGVGRLRTDRLNVMAYVRNGQIVEARNLMVEGKRSLQAVLDRNADFMTVGKGVRTPRKRNKEMEAQREIPFIFRHS